ncbi:hypothetical protein Tco_1320221 [Tanacetum coccineum]
MYPEYIPQEDEILPAEEQPLPAVALPTADSPRYVPESDPEEDDEDPEEDPANYPADRDDDDDDDDEDEDEDEDEYEEEEEEEEHPAPADSVPPVHPSPPASPIRPLGYRAAMIRLRAETPSTSHPLPLPSSSPPLQLLSSDHRTDRPEITLPPRKRLGIDLGPRYDIGKSSAAAATRPIGGRRADYGFVGTMYTEIRRRRAEEVGYGIKDVWVDPREAVEEVAPMTLGGVNTREALVSREAWGRSIEAADRKSQVVTLEMLQADYQRQVQLTKALELLKGLQTQMAEFQRQLGPAKGPAQPDAPGEAATQYRSFVQMASFKRLLRLAKHGFVGTMDTEIRRRRNEEVGYGIRDVWVDPREAVEEVADRKSQVMTLEMLQEDYQRQVQLTKALELLKGLQTQMVSLEAAWTQKKMAPKRKTMRLNPDATPTPVTDTHTTTSVTNAQIQAMINEGVTAALAARDATRNGDDSHTSGTGARRPVQVARECTYPDFLKCQPLNFKGTEGVVGLTQWFEKIESVYSISNVQ